MTKEEASKEADMLIGVAPDYRARDEWHAAAGKSVLEEIRGLRLAEVRWLLASTKCLFILRRIV